MTPDRFLAHLRHAARPATTLPLDRALTLGVAAVGREAADALLSAILGSGAAILRNEDGFVAEPDDDSPLILHFT